MKKLRVLKTGDKRAHPRKEFLPALTMPTDEFFLGKIHNISEGGMFIATKKPLPAGTEPTLAFMMPKSGIPIKVKGEVVWTGEKGMGVKFKHVDESTKKKLKYVLSKM